MNVGDAILKVAEACVEDARTLARESSFVRSTERRGLLSWMARERATFAATLWSHVRSGRSRPPEQRSFKEWGRTQRNALFGRLGIRNDGDAVANCQRSRQELEELYEQAIALPWSAPGVLPLLVEQRRRIRIEARRLREVLHDARS